MSECKLFVDKFASEFWDKSDSGFWAQMERLNQYTMTPEDECKTFYIKQDFDNLKDGNK